MAIFEGSAVALVTPFTEDGVNVSALKKLLDYQLEGGTDAIKTASLCKIGNSMAWPAGRSRLNGLLSRRNTASHRCFRITGRSPSDGLM